MIAAMVGGLVLLMLALAFLWILSPTFREWVERPKFQMLQREKMYELAELEKPDAVEDGR